MYGKLICTGNETLYLTYAGTVYLLYLTNICTEAKQYIRYHVSK